MADRGVAAALADKRILITGGTGVVGSSLVRQLRDVACHVTLLSRNGARVEKTTGVAAFEYVQANIEDSAVWDRTLQRIDVVFHLAAQTSAGLANREPVDDLRMNASAVLHLLEACRRTGRKLTVVLAGSATQVGVTRTTPVSESHPDRPASIYDLHKCFAEGYVEYFAREGVVGGTTLRLANVYGPGPTSGKSDRGVLNRMMQSALDGIDLQVYGTGAYVRDYVFVDDVAAAFLAAAAHIDRSSGHHFVVGAGKGHTIAEAANRVADAAARRTGRRVAVKNVDPPTPLAEIETRSFIADVSELRRATGWSPTVFLPEGIERTMDAIQMARRS